MSLCGGKEIGAGEGVGKREPVGVERMGGCPAVDAQIVPGWVHAHIAPSRTIHQGGFEAVLSAPWCSIGLRCNPRRKPPPSAPSPADSLPRLRKVVPSAIN